jgi:hypothetical protein
MDGTVEIVGLDDIDQMGRLGDRIWVVGKRRRFDV